MVTFGARSLLNIVRCHIPVFKPLNGPYYDGCNASRVMKS
jgi:hypothetical protein